MSGARRPPRLLVKTTAVTFITASALLSAVLAIVFVSAQNQTRQTVREHLESGQRLIAAVERRGQRDLRLQAASLAESPTLKAAMDTYAAEQATAAASERTQLLNTIVSELAKVAARTEADAVVVVDGHQITLAAAGRLGTYWPAGGRVPIVGDSLARDDFNGVVHLGTDLFRVVAAPLLLGDGTSVGTLYLATWLDRHFAEQLGELARTDIAIVSDGALVASTLASETQREFEAALSASVDAGGSVRLKGESFAVRQLIEVADTRFYALASVDASASDAIRETTRSVAAIAVGALSVALLGSIWLAHSVSKPIGSLSESIDQIAASRKFSAGLRLPRSGSSRELDQLTDTFNGLMASVAAAEGETEAAYTAAIRALAAALDARDPYTAGHSERVSALSVAMGKVMGMPPAELDVVRLGALLHDIGKIGVPDHVLLKPGPLTAAEFDIIKQHPGLGARILRNVPFLKPHLPIVEWHHERPDGRGYPYGLHSEDIPLAVHIVHVADAFDAMTSARAYRPGRPAREAMRELRAGAGAEFHAEAVAALATSVPGLTALIGGPVEEALTA